MTSNRTWGGQIFLALSLVLSLVLTQGCNKTKAKPASEAPVAAAPSAILGPGDEVEIKFYYAPELNTQQRIRPDGCISMQLVGDVVAAGLSPAALDQRLEEAYSDKLRYPEIAVIVRGSYTQRVLVGGEVQRPGAIEMPAKLSLMEAIILSGGFAAESANKQQVIIMRENADGERVGYAVDMRDAIKGGSYKPFMLAAGDIVYVPRSGISDVNLFIEQYINGVVPDIGLFYRRDFSNGSIGVDTSR